MKIVLIIYVVSWLILLVAYINSRFPKKEKTTIFEEKTQWYVYVGIFVFAPLVVVLAPYFLLETFFDNKKAKKRKAKETAIKEIEDAKKAAAKERYLSANQVEDNYAAIGEKLSSLVNNNNYNSFMKELNKVSLPNGATLIIEKCNYEKKFFDESKLLVQLPNGKTDKNIFDYLMVEHSCMGAWQAYLLHTLWYNLPMWVEHANRGSRKSIYSEKDVKEWIYDEDEFERKISTIDVAPEVRENGDKFYVSGCSGTLSGNIVRQYYEITIIDNKVVDIYNFNSKSLYSEDHPIRFNFGRPIDD